MLKLLNWWPNLYRENDPDEMTDAWAVSLAGIPYDAAMAGAADLSRRQRWPPTVAEICEAAQPYMQYKTGGYDKWDLKMAMDRYTELGIPLPPWFAGAAKKYATQLPQEILAALPQGDATNGK